MFVITVMVYWIVLPFALHWNVVTGVVVGAGGVSGVVAGVVVGVGGVSGVVTGVVVGAGGVMYISSSLSVLKVEFTCACLQCVVA